MGAKAEQAALSKKLRSEGATWRQVIAEFHTRWGLNARQTLRVAQGMSQQAVANEWCRRWPDDAKTFKNISTWELWPETGHMPSLVVLDRLARIYRCSVSDLVADFTDHGTTEDEDVDRRTLLLGTLTGAFALKKPVLRSRQVAPELPQYFEDQLSSHYKADMLLGPHLVTATVVSQYQAICEAIDLTTGDLHNSLLRVAAGYGALAGWLYQDAGDLSSASAWRSETLEMAHRCGDPHLVSYALTNKAMLRVEVGDGVGAVDLTTASLAEQRRLAPKVQVLALVQAAQGYSLIGDRSECDRSLDQAAERISDVDDDWPWGNAFRRTPHYIDAQRATCYGRLGLANQSAELWGHVINQQPRGYRRDQGVYLARHARALVDAGEPSAAVRPASQAVACLHDTGSARMRLELARLADKATSWTHTSAGRDLNDALVDVH